MSHLGKKKREQIRLDRIEMQRTLARLGFEEEETPIEPCCEGPCEHEQNNPFRWKRGKWTVEFGGGVGRVTDWQLFDCEKEGQPGLYYKNGMGVEALNVYILDLPKDKTE